MKVKLDDVCTRGSSNLKQKDITGMDGNYPIYGASGLIGNADFYHQEHQYVAVVKDGAGIGRTVLLPGKSSVIGTLQYLQPKNNVLPEYLYYAVCHMHLEKYFSGATIPHIYFRDYKNEEFNLDSLEKQKEIVLILNHVAEVITKRKRQLAEFDTLVKARFVEMFGDLGDPACKWETCMLSEACEKPDDIKCGPFGTQLSKDEYQNSGVAVWEIPQINSQFTTTPTHFVTKNKAEILSAYSLVPGDIAMSRKGNVGKCAVFPNIFEVGIIHSDVLRIRLDYKKADPMFMMNQLHNSAAIQNQIAAVSNGAVMAGINVTKLKRIEVYLPPLKLQNQFSEFIAQIDKSKFHEFLKYTEVLFNITLDGGIDDDIRPN